MPNMKPHQEDEVYAIIRNMSRTEKRYFKLFSPNSNSERDYIELFDIYDKMKEFELDSFMRAVRRKRWGKDWMKKRDFLKHRILAAMRAYHGKSTRERVVRLHLDNFDYLKKKGNYKTAAKELRKAKKEAGEAGLLTYLLRINELERILSVERRQDKDYEVRLKEQIGEQQAVMRKLEAKFHYLTIFNHILLKFRKGKLSGGMVNMLNSLEDLAPPGETDDFSVWKNYRMSQAMLAYAEGNWENFNYFYGLIVKLYEEHGRIRGEYLSGYIKAKSNYLESLRRLQEFKGEFGRVLEEMEAIMGEKGLNRDDMGEVGQCWVLNKLLLVYNEKLWEEAPEALAQSEKFLEEFSDKINLSRELTIKMNLALIYFALERWEEAEKWMQQIFTDKRKGIRPNFIRLSQLLLVVVCFEQERLDDFDRKYRAANRNDPLPFFIDILRKVKRIHHAPLLKRSELFGEMVRFIEEKQPELPSGLPDDGLAELYYWAKSRACKTPIRTTMMTYGWPPGP